MFYYAEKLIKEHCGYISNIFEGLSSIDKIFKEDINFSDEIHRKALGLNDEIKLTIINILLNLKIFPSAEIVKIAANKKWFEVVLAYINHQPSNILNNYFIKNLPSIETPKFSSELLAPLITNFFLVGNKNLLNPVCLAYINTNTLSYLLANGHFGILFSLLKKQNFECTMDNMFFGIEDLLNDHSKQIYLISAICLDVISLKDIKKCLSYYIINQNFSDFHLHLIESIKIMKQAKEYLNISSLTIREEVFIEFKRRLKGFEKIIIGMHKENRKNIKQSKNLKDIIRRLTHVDYILAHSMIIKILVYCFDYPLEISEIKINVNNPKPLKYKNSKCQITISLNYDKKKKFFESFSDSDYYVIDKELLLSTISKHIEDYMDYKTEKTYDENGVEFIKYNFKKFEFNEIPNKKNKFLAILSYFNQKNSSLVSMINQIIENSRENTFFLSEFEDTTEEDSENIFFLDPIDSNSVSFVPKKFEYPKGMLKDFDKIRIPETVELKELCGAEKRKNIINFFYENKEFQYKPHSILMNYKLVIKYLQIQIIKDSFWPYNIFTIRTMFKNYLEVFKTTESAS